MEQRNPLPENPWNLPPKLRDDDEAFLRALTACAKAYFGEAKRCNALLNFLLACAAVFLCLIFPLSLYHSLSGSDSFFGWRLLWVTENSMEPVIRTGALVLARESDFSEIEAGDIIVYACPDGQWNTRRVIAHTGGSLRTQGDNAAEPEARQVTEESYRCEVRKIWNCFAALRRKR
jgi:signal peptidase I